MYVCVCILYTYCKGFLRAVIGNGQFSGFVFLTDFAGPKSMEKNSLASTAFKAPNDSNKSSRACYKWVQKPTGAKFLAEIQTEALFVTTSYNKRRVCAPEKPSWLVLTFAFEPCGVIFQGR